MQSEKYFSIVIPTRNRPARLAECLGAVGELSYPDGRFEVIVVDDDSATDTERAVAPFRERLNVTLIKQPHGGPAKARNTGVKQAKGKYLAFTDDDCAPAADWLQTLSGRFDENPNDLIGGRTLNGLPGNPYSTTSQMLIDYLYFYYNHISSRAAFFASNNMSMSVELFRALGGFNEQFQTSEDRELCDRWRLAGYSLVYAEEAQVYHRHSLTFSELWRQHFNYGRGACHFQNIRADRGLKPIRLEPMAFYRNMIAYPFAQRIEGNPWCISGLLALTQAATAAGFYWERIRKSRIRAVPGARPPSFG